MDNIKTFDISVVIPMYNAKKYISDAIQSALNQPEVKEVILVDDGSDDGCFELCEKLVLENNKIKLYFHENRVNKGPGASRNLGIEKANCEYVSFLDADDVFLENRFLQTKIVFNGKDADGVYECIGTIYEDNELFETYITLGNKENMTIDQNVNAEQLFERLVMNDHGNFSIIGLTLKSEVAKSNLFNTTLLQCQDTDFIWTLALHYTLKPGNLLKPVSYRRLHKANRSISMSKEKILSKLQLHKIWLEKPEFTTMPYKIKFKLLTMYLSYNLQLAEIPFSYPRMALQFLKLSIQRPGLILKTMKW